MIVFSVLQFILLGVKIFTFGYLSEEIEYVRLVGSFAATLFCSIELMQVMYNQQLPDTIIMAIVITVVIERLRFIKAIFKRKYMNILRKEYKDM